MKLSRRAWWASLVAVMLTFSFLLGGIFLPMVSATISSSPSAIDSQYSCEKGVNFVVTVDNGATPNYYAIAGSGTTTVPCGTLVYGGPNNAGAILGTSATAVLQAAVTAVSGSSDGGIIRTQGLINASLITITGSKVSLISDTTATGTPTKNLILMNLTLDSKNGIVENTIVSNARIFSLTFHAAANQITYGTFNNDAFVRQKSNQGIFITGGAGGLINYMVFYNPVMLDSAPTVAGHGMITWNNTHSGGGQFEFIAPNWTSTGANAFTFLQVNGIIQENIAFVGGSIVGLTTNVHLTVVNMGASSSLQEAKFIGNEFELHGVSTFANIANGPAHATILFEGNTICICSTNVRQYLINNSNTYANWSQPSSFTFAGNDFTAQSTSSVTYSPGVQGANWQVTVQTNSALPNPTQSVQGVRATTSPTDGANSPVSTTLTMPLISNTNYNFYCITVSTNAASSTLNFQIATIAGATLTRAIATGAAGGSTNAFATNIMGASSASAGVQEIIAGTITMGSTTGTFELDFINPAALGTTTFLSGSFCWVWQVP